MINAIFYGNYADGKLRVQNAPRFYEFLKNLAGEFEMTISKKGRQRTDKQNRWYWGVAVRLISEYTGIDPLKVHEILKQDCGFIERVTFSKKNGQEYATKIFASTKTLLTTEFNQYKERVQQWAIENCGVIIPDPSEAQPK